MRKKNETDYQFLCRQVDKCIELLQDLKSKTIVTNSSWINFTESEEITYKSKIKRTRKQINDWLSQTEKNILELQRLGLVEDEIIN